MCLPSSCYAHVYTGDSQAAAPGAGLPRCLHQAWPGPSLAGVGVGEVEAGAGDNPFHGCGRKEEAERLGPPGSSLGEEAGCVSADTAAVLCVSLCVCSRGRERRMGVGIWWWNVPAPVST